MANNYNIHESKKKVSLLMNWFGCEGLRLVQTLHVEEQEEHKLTAELLRH